MEFKTTAWTYWVEYKRKHLNNGLLDDSARNGQVFQCRIIPICFQFYLVLWHGNTWLPIFVIARLCYSRASKLLVSEHLILLVNWRTMYIAKIYIVWLIWIKSSALIGIKKTPEKTTKNIMLARQRPNRYFPTIHCFFYGMKNTATRKPGTTHTVKPIKTESFTLRLP